MRSQRAFWVIAAVSVALAMGAYGVRGMLGGRTAGERELRAERDRQVAEMLAALDFDPRVRLPQTQRLVARAAAFSGDPATETAETLYALGLFHYYGESDTAAAMAAFRAAHDARPEWAWPVNALAIVEFVTGRRDEALDRFDEALRLQPGWSRPHADMAILFRRAGEMAEALVQAQTALEIEPGHPINHYNYGVILDELGRHAEARSEYLKTIELAPGLPQAHYNLACGYAREGNIEQALGPLERAIALEPAFREDAATDPDFGPVRNDPRFAVVAGTSAA